jgi:hypothetical protein
MSDAAAANPRPKHQREGEPLVACALGSEKRHIVAHVGLGPDSKWMPSERRVVPRLPSDTRAGGGPQGTTDEMLPADGAFQSCGFCIMMPSV